MALRLIEVVVPSGDQEPISDVLRDHEVHAVWHVGDGADGTVHRVLAEADRTEVLLNDLDDRYGDRDGFRAVVLHVEATIPAPVEPAAPTPGDPDPPARTAPRIALHELYADIQEHVRVTSVFLILTALSSLVAAIGLYRDDVAVIIGAMVIAPLLGPNVAMALAVTLADPSLGRRAARILAAGVLVAFGIAVVLGLVFAPPTDSVEIGSRTAVSVTDVVLALAAGSAGALSLTTGVPAALVGVMVAVALMPPLVAFGILLGSGDLDGAYGAFLLIAANMICINLSGVLTFMLQGVRPHTYWEAAKARRASLKALFALTVLLAVLTVIIWFSGPGGGLRP